MDLLELKNKLPEELQPLADAYGPSLLNMATEELSDLVKLWIHGDYENAYLRLYENLSLAAALAEGEATLAAWDSANKDNAERLELQRKLVDGLIKIAIVAALAPVGL